MAQIEEVYTHAGLTDTVRSSLFVGSTLFAGCADLTGRDFTTKAETHKYAEHKGSIYSLALIDSLLYSGSADKTFKAWDLRASKSVHTYQGHTNTVRCIASAEINGKLHIITGSYDGTVKIWNSFTRTCVVTLKQYINYINCLYVNYPYFWTGGEGIAIKRDLSAELRSYLEVNRLKGHSDAITGIHMHEENIITSSVDGTVKVWKEKGKDYGGMQTLQTGSPAAASILIPEVNSMFTCGATIKVWATEGWYNSFTEDSHKKPIRSLASYTDETGSFLASGSQDKSQKVWRIVS